MKARIWNHRSWIKNDEIGYMRDVLKDFLIHAGFGIVGFSEVHFQPQGYTAVWLLAESHLAIHTFPEENRVYCEPLEI
jgi:S-adenosylmethionine decarboxylase